MDEIIPLICTLFFVSPSTNLHPKAANYWETGSKVEGASLSLDERGVTLKGAMINKTWKDFMMNVRDTTIRITFDGPVGPTDDYNEITLNRLTAGGFLFFGRTNEDANPSYSVRCQKDTSLGPPPLTTSR